MKLLAEELLQPNQLSRMHKWHSFWQEGWEIQDQWPGEWAAVAAIRICQSHGDDDVLNEAKLQHFEPADPDVVHRFCPALRQEDGAFDLYVYFGDEDLALVKELIPAASAALSLCDLCDIGRSRLGLPPSSSFDPAAFALLISDDCLRQRMTFYHMAGHALSTIEFTSATGPVLHLPLTPDGNLHLLLMCTSHGPAADLLKWGHHPQLVATLRRNLWPTYQGSTVHVDSMDVDTWDELLEVAIRYFPHAWLATNGLWPDISAFGSQAAASFLYDWVVEQQDHEVVCEKPGRYQFIHIGHELRRRGLVYDDYFELTSLDSLRDSHCAAVMMDVTVPGVTVDRANSYLATHVVTSHIIQQQLQLGRDLDDRGVLLSSARPNIRLAVPTSSYFSSLLNGPARRNTIVMVYVEPGRALHTYKEMLRILRDDITDDSYYMLFFGDHDAMARLSESADVPVVTARPRDVYPESYRLVAKQFEDYDSDKFDDLPTQPPRCCYSHIENLYVSLGDAGILVDSLLDNLSENGEEGRRDAYSTIVLLTLDELLPTEITTGALDVIRDEYRAISEILPPSLMEEDFDQLAAKLRKLGVRLGARASGSCHPHIAPVQILDELVRKAEEAHLDLPFWPQRVVVTRLAAVQRVFNTYSRVFNSSIRLFPFEHLSFHALCDDTTVSLKERVVVLLGMAVRLGAQSDTREGDVSAFASQLASAWTRGLPLDMHMLFFQAAFHLATEHPPHSRQHHERHTLMLLEALRGAPIPLLGVFEALTRRLAGSTAPDSYVRRELRRLVDQYSQLASEALGRGIRSANSVAAAMAYDILVHYAIESIAVTRLRNRFDQRANRVYWHLIGSYVHTGGGVDGQTFWRERGDRTCANDCRGWGRMRIAFHKVLEAIPPWLQERQMVTPDVIDRARRLSNAHV